MGKSGHLAAFSRACFKTNRVLEQAQILGNSLPLNKSPQGTILIRNPPTRGKNDGRQEYGHD
jgi:hypothetical protein